MDNFYQLQLDVIQGKANGKILWLPRIGCWYDDKIFAGESLLGIFAGKDLVGVYEELSMLETEERIETPIGSIMTIIKRNTSNGGSFPSKWWVENEKDLKVMSYVLANQTYERDEDTRELLKYAKETGLDGIEVITPKPQGDVTLKEVKEALGDDVWLVDGLAAILFDEQFSEEELMAQVEECITLFAPKLILGISDELSSTGDVERVRKISQRIDEYNRARN